MNDKPTPETDAKASPHIGFYSCETVPAEFARKLERERDEARESLKHISEYGTEEINATIDLRQKLATALVERDEAKSELVSEKYWLIKERDDAISKAMRVEFERDELRDELEKIKNELY